MSCDILYLRYILFSCQLMSCWYPFNALDVVPTQLPIHWTWWPNGVLHLSLLIFYSWGKPSLVLLPAGGNLFQTNMMHTMNPGPVFLSTTELEDIATIVYALPCDMCTAPSYNSAPLVVFVRSIVSVRFKHNHIFKQILRYISTCSDIIAYLHEQL